MHLPSDCRTNSWDLSSTGFVSDEDDVDGCGGDSYLEQDSHVGRTFEMFSSNVARPDETMLSRCSLRLTSDNTLCVMMGSSSSLLLLALFGSCTRTV